MGRQKQFSVRKSSRKCVKKSTNEMGSSSKRNKSVEENFITQCRPKSLYDLVKSLSPEQKSDIRSVGFGGLLSLDTPYISVDLLRPFVQKFNGVSRLLTINDKFSFVVTADDICDVFQLPRVVGKEVIECKWKDYKDLDIVNRWSKDHQIKSNTYMSDLKEKLLSFVEGGEDFVRLFVLFSLSSFLCPTANRLIRFKTIKSVLDVKSISDFDWCSYVLKELCKAVVKFNNDDVLVKNCSGCLFVLPILYFHRLKLQGIAEPSTLPLVQHWTHMRIQKRFKEEISSGGLGNGVWEEGLFPISKGSSIEELGDTSRYKLPDDQPSDADLEKTSKDMQIFVKKPQGNTTTLNVESNETIFTIKRKLKEKERMRSDMHLVLIYNGTLLEDGHTLADYDISKESTLRLFLSQDALADEPCYLSVRNTFFLDVKREYSIDDVKAKIQEEKSIPSHKQLLFYCGKWLEDGSRTLAHYDIPNRSTVDLAIQPEQAAASQLNVTSEEAARQNKRARPATPTKATAALVPDPPSSVLTELEDLKREMATARNKEKELEATISRLKAQNKKNEDDALNKEKGLEATISGLKAGSEKTEEELMLARNKEKELEATVSGLRHKNNVFSDQCASYESLVEDLEVENKKTKEELMNADKIYYAGARAAGYAEGLEEGKANRLKFLHHLADTSMRYFNHGFDSCLKQAEEHGFCGQLNKDSALKDAPEIKGWESTDQPH